MPGATMAELSRLAREPVTRPASLMNHGKDDDLAANDLVRDREREPRDDVAAHPDTSAGPLWPCPRHLGDQPLGPLDGLSEVVTCAGTVVVVPVRCRFVLGERLGEIPNIHLRDARRARSASRTWAWAAAASMSCAVPFSIDADRRSSSATHASAASSSSSGSTLRSSAPAIRRRSRTGRSNASASTLLGSAMPRV